MPSIRARQGLTRKSRPRGRLRRLIPSSARRWVVRWVDRSILRKPLIRIVKWRPHGDLNPGRYRERVVSEESLGQADYPLLAESGLEAPKLRSFPGNTGKSSLPAPSGLSQG